MFLIKLQAEYNGGPCCYLKNILFHIHRCTSKHFNADTMSRLSLPNQPTSTPVPAKLILLIESLNELPITASQIAAWTQKDTRKIYTKTRIIHICVSHLHVIKNSSLNWSNTQTVCNVSNFLMCFSNCNSVGQSVLPKL